MPVRHVRSRPAVQVRYCDVGQRLIPHVTELQWSVQRDESSQSRLQIAPASHVISHSDVFSQIRLQIDPDVQCTEELEVCSTSHSHVVPPVQVRVQSQSSEHT